jgi:hypothetical protein
MSTIHTEDAITRVDPITDWLRTDDAPAAGHPPGRDLVQDGGPATLVRRDDSPDRGL